MSGVGSKLWFGGDVGVVSWYGMSRMWGGCAVRNDGLGIRLRLSCFFCECRVG